MTKDVRWGLSQPDAVEFQSSRVASQLYGFREGYLAIDTLGKHNLPTLATKNPS